MTLTCQKRKRRNNRLYLALLIVAVYLFPIFASAQSNGLALSVTPTLFEMTAVPGQVWESSVKVINSNPHHLTVYADVVNFAPQGETGHGKFLPVFEDFTEGTTLAEWVDITSEPIVVPPGESQAVPFTVLVPDNAAPGGHFAAIMIGTRPPEAGAQHRIGTSQIVTSLFFVRLAGDVIERGQIREFTTERSFLSTPEVNFDVRFENKGNVHIQPQGEIVIKNMWGKERGLIPINHHTHFGNVLPESVRKFEFMWRGEQSFSDIGRYSAELTLAYGTDNRQFASSKTYFWVVPIKSVLTVLFSIVLFVLFVMWAIRSYVRHMMVLEGYQLPQHQKRPLRAQTGDVLVGRHADIAGPVRAGWLDLTERLKQTREFIDTLKALMSFCWQYRLFFGAVLVTIIIGAVIWYFVSSVLKDARDYEVTIDNAGTDVTLSSEEILYQQQTERTASAPSALADPIPEEIEQGYELVIVNSSDTTGLAAATQRRLEPDYQVSSLQSDLAASKDRSVIVYHADLQEEALALRDQLGDFILSALPPDSDEYQITIYLGNDYSIE